MKKILGLDLGTNSIGWALVEIDHEKRIVRILGLGSRILNMDSSEIAKFESGAKLSSAAAQRTERRTPRKLNERYLLRRDRLHCVLNLLNTLPPHYKLSIEFENEKGKRSGKFKSGTEEKFAYSKDENGKDHFLFMNAYEKMEADFKLRHPELFYQKRNGNITKIPYDWTLYYLRHKAVTDPSFELTKEQLAWITLSFNQKRGYEKVIGQDEKVQKEGERSDTFIGKVKSVQKLQEKDIYEIVLSDINNEALELFRYKEESTIPITEIGDLKEIERVSKFNDTGEIDNSKTEYIVNEIRELLITNVQNTWQKRKENFVFEIELETGWIKEQQSRFTPKWKDTKRDFIIKTKYDEQGDRILKGADKGRNIGIPKEEDWTLMKLKTETSITNFNTKNNTVGIASFVYYNLLQNPRQRIKGDLVTVIERDYYREELDRIFVNQEKFHPELKNRILYEQAIKLLYPNNINHQKTIKELDFNYLIKEDILMYQRDLKSKKSLIADCVYEKRRYRNGETHEMVDVPIKAIHKFNPLFQEFRLWQFVKRLKILKKQDVVNNETKLNIDVTSQYLNSIEIKEKLFDYLNDKDFVTEKNILDFLSKTYNDKTIKSENYKWNLASEKEPCNTTRHEFILRTKRVNGFDYKSFLSSETEYKLWHFFYSVKRKEEFYKGLNSLFSQILEKSGLSKDYLPELVRNFSSFGGYPNDYGTYSEKAIKKLLPFLRLGKYWDAKEVENNLKKDLPDEISKKVIDKESINGEINDFQGLWVSSACYLVYGRYSEVGEVEFWNSPYDIEKYLQNEFKQHSLNNPVVEKVLVETLHLVKDVWKYYGEKLSEDEKGNPVYAKLFDKIHIELGREMKKNNKQKEKDDKQNKENRKANERIIEILKELKKENTSLEVKSPFQQEKLRILEEGLLSSIEFDKDTTEYNLPEGKISKKQIKEITTKEISKVSRSDFERYKLWLDQRYQSPYTGQIIKLSDLFDRKKYEIEHIFPQERITLNALSNKVICETEINKIKGSNTGYGFIIGANEREIFCAAHNEKIKILSVDRYEQLVTQNFIDKKREILLSKDIPGDFTNSQKVNMQYISKMAMKLLSNVVRDQDDDSYRSKNVLATNGTITSELKRHWKLNEAWNELTSPRFKRLNELTNSNLFGDYRKINGHDVFVNDVPEATKKDFDPKRIDHRHHAMDALVIASTTEEHVQYLNNISSQEENDEQKLKTRKGLKYILTNSRRGFNDEKEWYFLPPAQTKSSDGISEFEYHYKEVKSKVFKDIAKEALDNTVASFKQKNRIIRQRWNKYLKYNENGQLDIHEEENLKLKKKYNVRQALHLDTFYGKVKIQNNEKTNTNVVEVDLGTAIKDNYDFFETEIIDRIRILRDQKQSNSEIISLLSIEYPKVRVFAKFVASRFGNELTSLASSDMILKAIESITDTGIQKILLNHLENYKEKIDEEGKEIAPQTLAFSPEGIKELNQNIKSLNNGKSHQPIYKVRMADAMGKRFFPVSEELAKSSKYVATAGDSNAFCGIYENGKMRKYYVPTLRESLINLKEGYDPCPQKHPEDTDYSLLFVLNPNDLVYVPTIEESERPKLVDFNNLNSEQMTRIYKFRDGSINKHGGVQYNFMPSNWATMIFKSTKELEKIKMSNESELKGEITLTTDKDKSQNSLEGNQIRSICWKLKVDRLGNISRIN
nr:CRISPR-associated protein Cas9 [uncultured bacterium]